MSEKLTPEQRVGVCAINILTSLSKRSLRELRSGKGRGSRSGQSYIPRWLLADLAAAVDAAWPGALDATIEAERKEAGS